MAGTTPIHNKQKKKAPKVLDEDDLAFHEKQRADEKKNKELAAQAKKGGPMNTGQQGISHSKGKVAKGKKT